jgi:MtrB/PioB family decaheme-associated outer membrane protein
MALWLLAAGAANAQQNTPAAEPEQSFSPSILPGLGSVDFGFRGTSFADNSDEARYQRYRDLRNGAFAEDFRWGAADDQKYWDVRATHVGYRDQQYAANYNNFGKVKASFEFSQIPLNFSYTTRTPYTTSSSGVLGLAGTPAQIQAGLTTAATYNTISPAFDLQLQRTITDFRFVYSATEHLDLSAAFKNIEKTGDQPWAGTFGFSDAVELATPVDTRTTDFGVAAEWLGTRGNVRIGYDGSFFHNNISTLIWDNPLRATNSPTAGPAQGRMSLWPNSDLNSGSVSGVMKVTPNSQATAYISFGSLSQNDALIPFTINAALASPALDRPTSDASAHITATAFNYNIRPMDHVSLNARFRSYDFANQTPVFHVANTVSYDTSVSAFADGGTSPYSFNRKETDLDASWTPTTYTALRAAYTYDTFSQNFRTFDSQNENILRLSADASGIRWLTVRGVYEYSTRSGTGLDEQSLDDIGEQVSLRQFDLSNRTTNRFSAVVLATPLPALSLNGSAFVGRDTRPDSGFGLLHQDTDGVSVGFDYVPDAAVSIGALYQFERYSSLQKSRQASSGTDFNDPTKDWMTDGSDHNHTFTASADLLHLAQNTDVRLAYDYVHGVSSYIYTVPANTTLAPISQLPEIFNTRNRLSADARYMVTPHLGIGLMYWYEKFTVDDFAFNPATLNTVSQPSFISLQYTLSPYTANTFWVRATYRW